MYRPRIILFLLVLCSALAVSGCAGSDQKTADERQSAATNQASDDDNRASAETDSRAETDDSGGEEPSRSALALGARLDRLNAIYAPVSARINFLTSADTLRRNALEGGAGNKLQAERTATVKKELERMRPILTDTRDRLEAYAPSQVQVRRVQRLMQSAIRNRLSALTHMNNLLDATAAGESTPEQLALLDDNFRNAWNESMRAAREATNTAQDLRSAAGLELAPEEAIR